jgi:2-keto-4-pentenoate hydratase
MDGKRESNALSTADLLLDARRTGKLLTDLPAEFVPADLSAAYAVQDRMAQSYGAIGGWKVGAPTPEATPIFAPMPQVWIAASGATMAGDRWRYRGLEAEIAFLVGKDLPPRTTAYTREETIAAMASCHPVIEVLESAFVDPAAAQKMSMIADMQMHGGFVYGPAIQNWQGIDFNAERVMLSVDGVVRVERTGSNTSGDLLKLLPWLANEGATRTGGLRKGQWVTTGSWTGNTLAEARSVVRVEFANAGSVDLRFA